MDTFKTDNLDPQYVNNTIDPPTYFGKTWNEWTEIVNNNSGFPTGYSLVTNLNGVKYIVGPGVDLTDADLGCTDLTGTNMDNVTLTNVSSAYNFSFAQKYLANNTFGHSDLPVTAQNYLSDDREWLCVRYIDASAPTWFHTNDDLKGFWPDSYKTLSDGTIVGATMMWSIYDYTDVLICNGNKSEWMIMNKDVIAENALNQKKKIKLSHTGANYKALMYNRWDEGGMDPEDPWLSYADHSNTNSIMYGEHNNPSHVNNIVEGNGIYVFINILKSDSTLFKGIVGTPTNLSSGYDIQNGYLLGPKVDLTGADLTGADLTNVDLTGTGIELRRKPDVDIVAGWRLVRRTKKQKSDGFQFHDLNDDLNGTAASVGYINDMETQFNRTWSKDSYSFMMFTLNAVDTNYDETQPMSNVIAYFVVSRDDLDTVLFGGGWSESHGLSFVKTMKIEDSDITQEIDAKWSWRTHSSPAPGDDPDFYVHNPKSSDPIFRLRGFSSNDGRWVNYRMYGENKLDSENFILSTTAGTWNEPVRPGQQSWRVNADIVNCVWLMNESCYLPDTRPCILYPSMTEVNVNVDYYENNEVWRLAPDGVNPPGTGKLNYPKDTMRKFILGNGTIDISYNYTLQTSSALELTDTLQLIEVVKPVDLNIVTTTDSYEIDENKWTLTSDSSIVKDSNNNPIGYDQYLFRGSKVSDWDSNDSYIQITNTDFNEIDSWEVIAAPIATGRTHNISPYISKCAEGYEIGSYPHTLVNMPSPLFIHEPTNNPLSSNGRAIISVNKAPYKGAYVSGDNRTASSSDSEFVPSKGTFDSDTSWRPATTTGISWYKIDLGEEKNIVGIVTRGDYTRGKWTPEFTVLSSNHGNDNDIWTQVMNANGEAVFQGNTNDTGSKINLFQSTQSARYIKVVINHDGPVALRTDLYIETQPLIYSSEFGGIYKTSAENKSNIKINIESLAATAGFDYQNYTFVCALRYDPAGNKTGRTISTHPDVQEYTPEAPNFVLGNWDGKGKAYYNNAWRSQPDIIKMEEGRGFREPTVETNDKWCVVILSHDTTGNKVYFNGQMNGHTLGTTCRLPAALSLGGGQYTEFADAQFGVFMIYKRAITDNEARHISHQLLKRYEGPRIEDSIVLHVEGSMVQSGQTLNWGDNSVWTQDCNYKEYRSDGNDREKITTGIKQDANEWTIMCTAKYDTNTADQEFGQILSGVSDRSQRPTHNIPSNVMNIISHIFGWHNGKGGIAWIATDMMGNSTQLLAADGSPPDQWCDGTKWHTITILNEMDNLKRYISLWIDGVKMVRKNIDDVAPVDRLVLGGWEGNPDIDTFGGTNIRSDCSIHRVLCYNRSLNHKEIQRNSFLMQQAVTAEINAYSDAYVSESYIKTLVDNINDNDDVTISNKSFSYIDNDEQRKVRSLSYEDGITENKRERENGKYRALWVRTLVSYAKTVKSTNGVYLNYDLLDLPQAFKTVFGRRAGNKKKVRVFHEKVTDNTDTVNYDKYVVDMADLNDDENFYVPTAVEDEVVIYNGDDKLAEVKHLEAESDDAKDKYVVIQPSKANLNLLAGDSFTVANPNKPLTPFEFVVGSSVGGGDGEDEDEGGGEGGGEGEGGGSTGDPYITPVYGPEYKLPNKDAVYRLFENKDVYINANVSKATEEKKQSILNYYKKHYGEDIPPQVDIITDGFYYDRFFIASGDAQCIISVDNGKINGFMNPQGEQVFQVSEEIVKTDSDDVFKCMKGSRYKQMNITWTHEELGRMSVGIQLYKNPQHDNGIILDAAIDRSCMGLLVCNYKPKLMELPSVETLSYKKLQKRVNKSTKKYITKNITSSNEKWTKQGLK